MNRILISFVMGVFIAIPFHTTHAQTAPSAEALIAQLQSLLKQLHTLQSELRAQKGQGSVQGAVHTLQLKQSKYYTGTYESMYTIENGTLIPYRQVHYNSEDIRLFDLFKTIIGTAATDMYLREFRIYRDEDAKYDAFVEQQDGDDWIFGVNRAHVGLGDRLDRESATELFVHEYAHILYHYEPGIAARFEEEFWSDDQRENDFVSLYAQQNAEEDFAESFAHYVLGISHDGSASADAKVNFFNRFQYFRDIRSRILNAL